MPLAPALDPYREEALTKNVSIDLLKQRTLTIKLIVCLDRFIQRQILRNDVKANIDAYEPDAFCELVEDLQVPNKVNFAENDFNRYSDEEQFEIEIKFENGTKKWFNKFFTRIKPKRKLKGRTPLYKPTNLCGNAYRERLKTWYKKGELKHVYGSPKADALLNHKKLIQDAIGDTLHVVREVEAEDLVQNKINYMESLREKGDAQHESKCVQSRIFSDITKEKFHTITFGGEIPVREDATADDPSDKYSRPVKIFWETDDGQMKAIKTGPKCNLMELISFVLSTYTPQQLMELGENDTSYVIAKASKFETTFRPEQFGIVEIIRKYLLPQAIDEGGMFDGKNHAITINLSHMEIYQANADTSITRTHTVENNTQLGTLLVRLPALYTGAYLSLNLPSHTPNYCPLPENTSIHYTIVPTNTSYTLTPIRSGSVPFLVYKVLYHPTTSIPPTLSLHSFPLFPIITSLLTAPNFLPRGGQIGMHLRYSYAHVSEDIEDASHLASLLRGSDLALFTILEALGLKPVVTAVVENDFGEHPAAQKINEHEFKKNRRDNGYRYNALNGSLRGVPMDVQVMNMNTYRWKEPREATPDSETDVEEEGGEESQSKEEDEDVEMGEADEEDIDGDDDNDEEEEDVEEDVEKEVEEGQDGEEDEEEVLAGFPGITVETGNHNDDTDAMIKWTLESEILLPHVAYLDSTPEAIYRLMMEYERRSLIRHDLPWGDNTRHLDKEYDSDGNELDAEADLESLDDDEREECEGYCYVLGEITDLKIDGVCDGSFMGSLFPFYNGLRRSDIKWVNKPRHQQVQGVYPNAENASKDEDDVWNNSRTTSTDIELEYCHSSAAIVFEVPRHKKRCEMLDEYLEGEYVRKFGRDVPDRVLRDDHEEEAEEMIEEKLEEEVEENVEENVDTEGQDSDSKKRKFDEMEEETQDENQGET